MKKNSSTAHNSAFTRVVCMLLVTVLLCGLGWTGIVASAESMQAGSAVSEQIADNMTEGAVETEQPAPTEAPEHMGELPTLDEALGLVAAPQGQTADGVYYFGEQTDTEGLYVKVEVIDKSEGAVLPEGAQLKLKASEKAAEYVRQSILKKAELADDEFFFLYDLSFVDKDGKEIDVGTGSGKSFKVTVYMAGEGNNFADAEGSLNVVSLPYTIGELETAEDIKLEEAEKKAADEPQTEDKPAEAEPAQTEQPAAEEKAEPVTEDEAEEPAPAEEPAKAEEANEAKAEEKVEEKSEEKTEETEKSVIPARETKVVVSDLLKVDVSYVFNTNGLGVFAFYGKKDMGNDATLYEEALACETKEEFLDLVANMSDDELDAFEASLDEEQVYVLGTHLDELFNNVHKNGLAARTDGMFLAPIKYCRNIIKATPVEKNGNGLETAKSVVANKNGSYTITLESYTTGTVTTVTNTVPVDIVLVLDQSGSMRFNFDGKDTSNKSSSRQYAMKNAVNNFINEVSSKYTDEADHRMAIVTFGSGASTLQDWTAVNANGKNALQGKINALPDRPEGATNIGAGMQQAQTLMESSYNYTGSNNDRQKVVVTFTDGVPTTQSDFDTSVANTAIAAAKRMKDSGTIIYSIGIFNGANPNELYGASGFDTNSDGTVYSEWTKDKYGLFPGTDFPEADRPAANRFLNYVSSNSSNASDLGLTRSTGGLGLFHRSITYKITANYAFSNNNYYLQAFNAEGLNDIFKTISESIGSPSISLGTDTVVRDVVTQYFDMPADATDVKLFTAEYNGTSFGDRGNAPTTVKASITGNIISVTGFDYNANFVTNKPKADGTYGKKLIIEFVVTPNSKFLGGNNVPTNGDTSGVYTGTSTLVELFDVPKVNVPVKKVTVRAVDKNIYLLGSLNEDELKAGADVKCNGFDLIAGIPQEYDWVDDYVTITVSANPNKVDHATTDSSFMLKAEVKPETAEISSVGTSAVSESAQDTANVNVYKPEVTYKDSKVDFNETPEYKKDNFVSTVWKHTSADNVTTEVVGDSIVMIGAAPALYFTYNPSEAPITSETSVKVVTAINGVNVTDHTMFIREACDLEGVNCTWDETKAISGDEPNFVVHLGSITITVTKNITGNMADVNGNFEIKVTYTTGASAGAPIDAIQIDSDGNIIQNPNNIFTNNTVKYYRIPSGVFVNVVETNDAVSSKYDTTIKFGTNIPAESKNAAQTVSVNTDIVVTNNKDKEIPMGVSLDSLPYIIVLAAVAVAAVVIILRKRRNNDD